MLYCDRTAVSEGIDINKTIASKKCDICHYWYFLDKGFKSQPNVCNRCHDLLMMYMNLNDIYISNIKNAEYCNGISKSEAITLLQKIDLTKKGGTLSKNKYQNFEAENLNKKKMENYRKKKKKLKVQKTIIKFGDI